MGNREIIELFVSRSFEREIDLLNLSDRMYIIPKQKIFDYVVRVIDIPFTEFIDYIEDHKGIVEDQQLTQSSNFTSCSSEMCKAIINQGNPGLRFSEIGQLFPQYIKRKNDGAFRKYGENQVKTSSQLGLMFEYYDYWYLTCVGYIYNELNPQQQRALLARTILRIPLYQELLLHMLEGNVNLIDYMKCLSPSTQGRRSGSIIKLLNFCLEECKRSGIQYHNLLYPTYVSGTKSIRIDVIPGTV